MIYTLGNGVGDIAVLPEQKAIALSRVHCLIDLRTVFPPSIQTIRDSQVKFAAANFAAVLQIHRLIQQCPEITLAVARAKFGMVARLSVMRVNAMARLGYLKTTSLLLQFMVLLDHFHPPLSTRRHWHSFHNAWSTYLSETLNEVLPEGYFAEPNAQFGIEIDVATYSERGSTLEARQSEMSQWTPQAPTATLPFQPTTDVVEVQVFSTQAGPTLVGAIELVSPANKDRPTSRDAFTSKCQTYLQQGIGLIVVDIVTTLNANLHNELMERLRLQTEVLVTDLYATSYRVAETNQVFHLDLWQETLTPGMSLPILPLYLKGGLCLPINLDRTYQATCIRQRII